MRIESKEEYIEFFPYKNVEITNFPKSYPCKCIKSWEEGGTLGCSYIIHVTYYPKDVTIEEAFDMGFNPKIEILFEG
jgi:hypothetical protein